MTGFHKFLQTYDVFVFDVDDTLLYTFKNGFRKLWLVADALGYPHVGYAEYAQLYGVFPFEVCLARWFPGADITLAKHIYQEASAQFGYEAVCDCSEIQALLDRYGKHTVILTNGHNDRKLKRKLKVCGVNFRLLSGLWGAEDLPALKPSALAIQPVKERFPCSALLYIGDSASDRKMAQAAGIGFLQVYSGKEGPLPGVPGVSSIKELVKMLRQW